LTQAITPWVDTLQGTISRDALHAHDEGQHGELGEASKCDTIRDLPSMCEDA